MPLQEEDEQLARTKADLKWLLHKQYASKKIVPDMLIASHNVGTLSNGYTRSGPLPRVAPFRAPIAKLTRVLAAHMSTITNAPYLGTVVGEHIT